MASYDSSKEGSFVRSRRMPASELCQREKSKLFPEETWGPFWRVGIDNGDYSSRIVRSRESTNSDRSSIATRRSSMASQMLYRRSMDATPVEHTPTPVKLRSMPSQSSLRHSGRPLNGVVNQETLQIDFAGEEVSAPVAETQPPRASPRSHIRVYRAGNERVPISHLSAPLDRYLAQQNKLIDFGDDLVRIEDELAKLRSLRTNALRLRSQIRLKRRELHEKQIAKSSVDEEFMRYVREQQPASESGLATHQKALQAARDDYGSFEYEYNALEDKLDEVEFELAKVEGGLYNPRVQSTPDSSESDPNLRYVNAPLPPPISLLGLSSKDELQNYHPLQAEYLSRLGDLDLARERHHNLAQQQEKLLWTQESRARVGLELQDHEKEFLAEYPAREAALLDEIKEIEEDVERWKTKCVAEGLDISDDSNGSEQEVNVDRSGIPEATWVPGEVIPDEDAPSERQNPESSHSMFPLLLPKPEVKDANLENLISEFDESNKGDRIKRWMLHKLRNSPLEVELLARVFAQVLTALEIRQWKVGGAQWEGFVLFYWDKDEAEKSIKGFKTSKSLRSVHATQIMPVEQRCHFHKFVRAPPKSPATLRMAQRTRSAPGSIDFGELTKGSEILKRLSL